MFPFNGIARPLADGPETVTGSNATGDRIVTVPTGGDVIVC